jgi:NADH-quinone oxidoreductase subunit J
MVLFLFVILLVNVEVAEREPKTTRQWKTGLVLGVVLIAELALLIVRGGKFFEAMPPRELVMQRTLNTEMVGEALFTEYLLPFEIASVLLLVAMVGAVVLAKKDLN